MTLQDIRGGVLKDFADDPDPVLEKLGDGLMALSFRSIEPGIRSGRKFYLMVVDRFSRIALKDSLDSWADRLPPGERRFGR